jgi:hypothetical protein
MKATEKEHWSDVEELDTVYSTTCGRVVPECGLLPDGTVRAALVEKRDGKWQKRLHPLMQVDATKLLAANRLRMFMLGRTLK